MEQNDYQKMIGTLRISQKDAKVINSVVFILFVLFPLLKIIGPIFFVQGIEVAYY